MPKHAVVGQNCVIFYRLKNPPSMQILHLSSALSLASRNRRDSTMNRCRAPSTWRLETRSTLDHHYKRRWYSWQTLSMWWRRSLLDLTLRSIWALPYKSFRDAAFFALLVFFMTSSFLLHWCLDELLLCVMIGNTILWKNSSFVPTVMALTKVAKNERIVWGCGLGVH